MGCKPSKQQIAREKEKEEERQWKIEQTKMQKCKNDVENINKFFRESVDKMKEQISNELVQRVNEGHSRSKLYKIKEDKIRDGRTKLLINYVDQLYEYFIKIENIPDIPYIPYIRATSSFIRSCFNHIREYKEGYENMRFDSMDKLFGGTIDYDVDETDCEIIVSRIVEKENVDFTYNLHIGEEYDEISRSRFNCCEITISDFHIVEKIEYDTNSQSDSDLDKSHYSDYSDYSDYSEDY